MSYSEAIVACARSWIGTRFHHQGRLKRQAGHKGGVDCLGLLVGVAVDLRLKGRDGRDFAAADERDYSHQPDVVKLRQTLGGLLCEKSKQGLVYGDVLLLNVDGNPQHLAIVSNMAGQMGMIHAYAPAKAVVEHLLSADWYGKIVTVYRVESGKDYLP